jgi:SAM-dependent methyltransferase
MRSGGWWRSFFDDAYFDLHEPLFDQARSRREVAGMMELLQLPVGARVLDAPCGWGRHTALLAEAGCVAVGADLSPALLRRAPRSGAAAGPEAEEGGPAPAGAAEDAAAEHAAADAAAAPVGYAAADIRALPFAAGAFDAVVNVFTSLGLFLEDAEDVAALREARRVLRPGGRLLLESMHRDDVVTAYAERDAWTLPDGTEVRVRRRFDAVTGISHERMSWRRGEARGRKEHALRLRTATEIAGLLREAGFDDVAWYGGWDGAPFTHRDESVIAVAVKPPSAG